jgi:glycosyl hydrolase family 31
MGLPAAYRRDTDVALGRVRLYPYKQRYASQDELLWVAKGHRERHRPADVLVLDWFHYTKMGEMDMDPAKWPDPTAMNRTLHETGFRSMVGVWPRYAPGSRYYDFPLKKGSVEKLADGTPTNGLPYDRAGSDIDTTNPEAARWYRDRIRENYVSDGSTHSGPMRRNPIFPRTAVTIILAPERASSMSIPGCIQRLSMTVPPGSEDSCIDPVARCVSRSAAERDYLLVVRHRCHLGHLSASDTHGPECYGFRNRLLGQRRRLLAVPTRIPSLLILR